MSERKQRLTVTVAPDLVEAGIRAVASKAAASLSVWVRSALAEKVRRDPQLTQLRRAIVDYETEFGEITAEEIASQQRVDREGSVVVRGRARRGGAAEGQTRGQPRRPTQRINDSRVDASAPALFSERRPGWQRYG